MLRALFLVLWPALAFGQGFLERNSPELETLRALKFHAASPLAAKPWELRVLTYNVHGIAPTLTGTGRELEVFSLSRYREIARRLREARASGRGPQIVAIQEAWHDLSARTANESGYPYVVKGGDAKFGKLAGSGLYILSEYPVLSSDVVAYKECTGWDCVATKGALHVRVVVPELAQVLDVYATHTNADGEPAKPEEMKARMAQLKDFAAFVQRTRDPGAPAVMAGDFNFRYPAEDSALFEALTGAVNAGKACAAAGSCEGDSPASLLKEVDHEFTLPGSRGALKPVYLAQTFKELHEGKPLSDHWGLEGHFVLLRPQAP